MKSIKFSKEYPKLHKQNEAELVSVRMVASSTLHQDLIEYDTKAEDGSYYELPRELLLHLTFIGDKLIPFCTIRRHTSEKEEYYQSLIGSRLKIERTFA